MKKLLIGAVAFAGLGFGGAAHAADCKAPAGPDDLTYEQAGEVYECLKESLYKGYQKGKKRWVDADHVKDYRDWGAASTVPANPGMHSNRYLFTYVNDIGFEAYTQYAEEPTIPVGTVIAKESFSISKNGKAKKGPLFFMEKVAEGVSPETNDWYYTMVAANGAPQAVNVYTACNECHSNYDFQGHLGYPVEEARLK